MYQFLTKNGQALAFGLGLVLIVLFLLFALPTAGEYQFDTMENEQIREVSIFNFGLWSAIILTVIAAAAMIIFGVAQVASNFKKSFVGILGFLALLVIFFIGYSISDGEPETARLAAAIQNFETSQQTDLTPGNLKFISGGIITSLVLMGLAVIALVVTGVINFFKR